MIGSNPRKQSRSIDDSLLPMINVVFLLLIFFMVAGRINAGDREIEPPGSVSEIRPQIDAIEISIASDANIRVGDSPVIGDLAEALARLGAVADTVVTCRVDRQLGASVLDPVMAAADALGISSLQIVTVLERE